MDQRNHQPQKKQRIRERQIDITNLLQYVMYS